MLFALLDMSWEVQSNRLTSEGTDGRWAAAAARLGLPELTVQSSAAKLQGNGREATDMTCISKKATILLVQHDSIGRTSQDKGSADHKKCTCLIAAAAQMSPRKTRKTLRNTHIQQLYLQHTHWQSGTGHAPNQKLYPEHSTHSLQCTISRGCSCPALPFLCPTCTQGSKAVY